MLPSQSYMETRGNCFGPRKITSACQGNWRSEKISKTVFNPNKRLFFLYEKKTLRLFADFARLSVCELCSCYFNRGTHIFHSREQQTKIYSAFSYTFMPKCKSLKISQSGSVKKARSRFSFFHKEVLKGLLLSL